MSWVRNPAPHPRARLIALPYAGGGTVEYRQWRRLLPADVDLNAVVLPGRESRLPEPPIHDMRVLVDQLVAAIAPLIRRTPYVVYGHSMGAWVAFELVRALRRLHRPLPEHLIVGARRAPHLPSTRPILYQLPDDAFLDAIQERYGGIPKALRDDPAVLRLFLPALRADFTLLDTYRHTEEDPLPMPITALAGTEDGQTTLREVRAWRQHTTGAFRMRPIAGGHFFLKDAREETAAVVGGVLRGIG